MINCLQVQGTSMRPFIKTGDYVLIKPCRPAETRIGDILAVKGQNDKLFVHRLVWRDNCQVVIKGDSVSAFGHIRLNNKKTVGKVISLIREKEVIRLNNHWLNFIKAFVSIWLIPFQIIRKH